MIIKPHVNNVSILATLVPLQLLANHVFLGLIEKALLKDVPAKMATKIMEPAVNVQSNKIININISFIFLTYSNPLCP